MHRLKRLLLVLYLLHPCSRAREWRGEKTIPCFSCLMTNILMQERTASAIRSCEAWFPGTGTNSVHPLVWCCPAI